MTELAVTEMLRARFRETAAIRLQDMAVLLERIVESQDRDAIDQLARHFHALAGMGGTYGYPEISTLGDEAETAMLRARRSLQPIGAAAIARWREVIREIAAIIQPES